MVQVYRIDRVVAQVPALNQLLSIRSLVQQMKDGAIDVETFRTRLPETGVDAAWAEQLYQTLSKAPAKPLAPRPPSSSSSSSSPSTSSS